MTHDNLLERIAARDRLTNQLRHEAEQLRAALSRVPGDHWFNNFRRFPLGCDRPAALVLGLWLERKGFGPVIIAWERRRHRTTNAHSWVEIGELIVDITGDLFGTDNAPRPPVIVTGDHRWHASFGGSDRFTIAELLEQRASLRRALKVLFVEVVQQLERES
jgi:hypothetical protein